MGLVDEKRFSAVKNVFRRGLQAFREETIERRFLYTRCDPKFNLSRYQLSFFLASRSELGSLWSLKDFFILFILLFFFFFVAFFSFFTATNWNIDLAGRTRGRKTCNRNNEKTRAAEEGEDRRNARLRGPPRGFGKSEAAESTSAPGRAASSRRAPLCRATTELIGSRTSCNPRKAPPSTDVGRKIVFARLICFAK